MIIAEEFIGPESWHGTAGGWTNHHCKCLGCRTAWNQYNLQARKDRAQRIDPDDPRHGRPSFYLNHGCRCDRCRKGNTEAKRAYRGRRAIERKAA